jgi:flagellar motility protein MotE (MotC chaperone)
MKLHLPAPRLMPFTIAAMAAVLAMKTTDLARFAADALKAAPASMVTAARAAVPDKTPPAMPMPALPSIRPADPPPVSDAERKVLTELRQRREELDGRDAALSTRESVLAAAEQKLTARIEELSALQKKLEALEAARRERQESGWLGLVKLYENMKPRDAATIFNDLQMPVLLALVDRMNERRAAPILAAMNPDKAREVTAELAQMRTRRESTGTPSGTGG